MIDADVLVLGLGHAGAEAALAAARLGCRVIGVSQVLERAGLMSCNPAIGGPGKSQLVAEIDALGGAMAEAADEAGLQFRLLNRSRGPAVQATRVQVDRLAYARAIQRRLKAQPGLTLVEGEASGFLVDGGRLAGILLRDGRELRAMAVVVTTGTFLSGRLHVGSQVQPGGRAGDEAAEGLSEGLRQLGLTLDRFKTGTPPRLDGRTLDYAACEVQPSESDAGPLSTRTPADRHPALPQRPSYVTHTQPATHEVVRRNLAASPLYTGAITSRGPRYCPSLEHKVAGYPDRDRHLVFLEPEGLETPWVYPAGLSTSLPEAVQVELLRTIPGLERVDLFRPGYAVEYDYVPAKQLTGGLQTRCCPGLFLAGQINGSSGYEEAAAQGLLAGINAARLVHAEPAWVPGRESCFLGVLCDDLVTRGFDEPYRMLPARAEARLQLREDNARQRLWRVGQQLGLTSAAEWQTAVRFEEAMTRLEGRLSAEAVRWLRRPETTLAEAQAAGLDPDAGVVRAVYLKARYEPYLKQRGVAEQRLRELAGLAIPSDLRLESVSGLSAEVRAALRAGRPKTLGEAQALSGMTSAALAVLAAHLKRRGDARAD